MEITQNMTDSRMDKQVIASPIIYASIKIKSIKINEPFYICQILISRGFGWIKGVR